MLWASCFWAVFCTQLPRFPFGCFIPPCVRTWLCSFQLSHKNTRLLLRWMWRSLQAETSFSMNNSTLCCLLCERSDPKQLLVSWIISVYVFSEGGPSVGRGITHLGLDQYSTLLAEPHFHTGHLSSCRLNNVVWKWSEWINHTMDVRSLSCFTAT